ncbi:adenosine deaminase/editase [Auriscalpium vulgare]|uniref:Adenosine deaminase/editase n=1 Tax=Auriscalpium vulgare TaxID=40419 RepID=A0ACB8RUX5_9AGAM|nr:adenosine deaminase/editase [Auriscalpium vulgare]
MSLPGWNPDDAVAATLSLLASISYAPQPGKFSILASISIVRLAPESTTPSIKVISLGTGSKCLPVDRLPLNGDALHDSHAEVLARRGAVRWLLEEVLRDADEPSEWIIKGLDGLFRLRPQVELCLYVSTVPCGDASTRLLASAQEPSVAALKDSTPWPILPPDAPSRGRDDYARLGVLRTKPGRADAPPVSSMACSDKIARWGVLGIQGALLSTVCHPVYLGAIVIGEVPESMRENVKIDCERAFWGRVGRLDAKQDGLPEGYRVSTPAVHLTSIPFTYSKVSLGGTASSSNDSLCWIAGSSSEVLINGLRRGVPPKHRAKEKFRPVLSKISFFTLYCSVMRALDKPLPSETTYYAAKEAVQQYQDAKMSLVGQGAPFSGWIRSGEKWESFDSIGTVRLALRDNQQ